MTNIKNILNSLGKTMQNSIDKHRIKVNSKYGLTSTGEKIANYYKLGCIKIAETDELSNAFEKKTDR